MSDPTEQETYRKSMDARFDTQDRQLDLILAQTKLTNGRVTALERMQDFVRGALWVIGGLLTLVILPLAFLLGQYLLK